MPRCLILSDLHLEFGEPYSPPPRDTYDVVILAGDTRPGLAGVQWAEAAFEGAPVLYEFGNHEFYGHAMPRLIEKARELGMKNVQIMEKDEVVMSGVRFLGATLWTDFAIGGDARVGRYLAQKEMNDYSRIRVTPQYRKLSAADTAAVHSATARWLEDRLSEAFDGPTVVVTHHAPHREGLGERGHLDVAYASDMTELMERHKIGLWIHGHTHIAKEYHVAGVRVISNARGYPTQDTGFNPHLIIQIGTE